MKEATADFVAFGPPTYQNILKIERRTRLQRLASAVWQDVRLDYNHPGYHEGIRNLTPDGDLLRARPGHSDRKGKDQTRTIAIASELYPDYVAPWATKLLPNRTFTLDTGVTQAADPLVLRGGAVNRNEKSFF